MPGRLAGGRSGVAGRLRHVLRPHSHDDATTTIVIALGLIRRRFTPDHRVMHLPIPADR